MFNLRVILQRLCVCERYSGSTKRPFTLLYSHGNGEDLFVNEDRVRELSRAVQCDVLAYVLFGTRCYGTAAGWLAGRWKS